MTITNRELFYRDPTETKIPNDGVAKVVRPETEQQWDVLAWELRSFVCDGQYARGLERILDSFLTNLNQSAATGGLGERLLRQRQVPSRSRARVPVARRRAARRRPGPRSRDASRRCPRSPHRAVDRRQAARRTVVGRWHLGVGQERRGRARVSVGAVRERGATRGVPPRSLHDLGYGERLPRRRQRRCRGTQAGRFDKEIHDLYVSPVIAKALLDCRSHPGRLGEGRARSAEGRSSRRRPRTSPTTRCSTSWTTSCGSSRRRTGSSRSRSSCSTRCSSTSVTTTRRRSPSRTSSRDCSARFESQVLFVATGQSALTATPTLQKLTDRFAVQVALSDKDVETVVREVVLRKKPEHVADAQVGARRGERRDRQAPWWHAARAEGGRQARPRSRLPAAAHPAPFLGAGPARDRPGRQGRRAANPAPDRSRSRGARRRRSPLGHVVGADFVYEEQSPGMLQSGVLLKEIDELIRGLCAADGRRRRTEVAHLLRSSSSSRRSRPAPSAARQASGDRAVPRRSSRRGPRRRRARLRKRVPELLDVLVGGWPSHAHRRRVPAADRRRCRVGEGLPQPPRRDPRRRSADEPASQRAAGRCRRGGRSAA